MKYILERLVTSVIVIVFVSFILFIMLNVIPGDPVALMMGDHVNAETIERIRLRMHLDDPVLVRFFRYIMGVFQGDFGYSYKLKREVVELIAKAFPNTLALAISSALVAWTIGIISGIISAIRKNSVTDYAVTTFSLLGVSMPVFWAALLLQYIFAGKLGWLPVAGAIVDSREGFRLEYAILPAIVLGWSSAAKIARLTRSSLLEVMSSDYIRTAKAKGLLNANVIIKHALQNSFLPVITVMAIQISHMLAGAVITESVFGIPGVGRITINAIQQRDMPLLQGAVMFTTLLIVGGNLVADLLYGTLDPRIKYK